MRYAQIAHKAAEVIFNLIKVLGGNWIAAFSLALSLFDLYQVFHAGAVQPA